MIALQHADGRRQKGYPDQEIARHLLGPRHRLAEAIAGNDRDDDDEEKRRGENDADPADDGDEQSGEAIQQIKKSHCILPRETRGAARGPRRFPD